MSSMWRLHLWINPNREQINPIPRALGWDSTQSIEEWIVIYDWGCFDFQINILIIVSVMLELRTWALFSLHCLALLSPDPKPLWVIMTPCKLHWFSCLKHLEGKIHGPGTLEKRKEEKGGGSLWAEPAQIKGTLSNYTEPEENEVASSETLL